MGYELLTNQTVIILLLLGSLVILGVFKYDELKRKKADKEFWDNLLK